MADLAVALLPFAPVNAKAAVERIVNIVRSSGGSSDTLMAPPSTQSAQRTSAVPAPGSVAPWSESAERRGGRTARWGAVGAGALVVLAGAATVGWRALAPSGGARGEGAAAAGFVAAPPPSVVAAATPSVESASLAPAATGAPAAMPSARPSVPAASAPAAAVQSAAAVPRETPVAETAAVAHRAAAPQGAAKGPLAEAVPSSAPAATRCDPPTFLDQKGHVHLKPGCQ
jgi:hypothetical protein